jgi:hypothetical protein
MPQSLSFAIAATHLRVIRLGLTRSVHQQKEQIVRSILLAALTASMPGLAMAEVIKSTGVSVPTDSGATYKIVVQDLGYGRSALVVISQRIGSSGTSFAIREVNCDAGTFRYMGEGDTLEQAMNSVDDTATMSPLVDGSISDYIVRAACS